jgi:hypothetical protein
MAAIAFVPVLVTAIAAVVGFSLAPMITAVVAPRFDPFTRHVTVRPVQVLFPMFGIVMFSAWCLGALGRLFLPYASGALWNIAR